MRSLRNWARVLQKNCYARIVRTSRFQPIPTLDILLAKATGQCQRSLTNEEGLKKKKKGEGEEFRECGPWCLFAKTAALLEQKHWAQSSLASDCLPRDYTVGVVIPYIHTKTNNKQYQIANSLIEYLSNRKGYSIRIKTFRIFTHS